MTSSVYQQLRELIADQLERHARKTRAIIEDFRESLTAGLRRAQLPFSVTVSRARTSPTRPAARG
jgi:hypothetical protein